MRLKDNFYRVCSISQTDGGEYRVEAELMADHPIYKGHFPQKAVVPGVCTLTIIKECLGEILARRVAFASIRECKYVSALTPQEGLRIIIILTIAEEKKVTAVVERADNHQTVLKLKATLE